LISIFLALAAQSSALDWAEFSRAGALSHTRETIAVRTARGEPPNRVEYQLIYTREHLGTSETFSTSSVTCPAARKVILSMRELTMPRPAPYGAGGDSGSIVLDGTTYVLSAPTNYPAGRMTISSNIGSPLARWVNHAFRALEPCWVKTG
jgi:hypothetical protein